jgi:hypothetical protein
MSKVIPLIGFGVGLMCVGFYWHLYNDVFIMAISPYVLTSYTAWGVSYSSDKYFDFMYMIWRLLPWVCVIVGVLLLIAAGASSSGDGQEVAE